MRNRHLHLLGFGTLIFALPVTAHASMGYEQEVIVTGVRLETTERALKDCLARKCSPEDDINATLAHAENQFVAGQYDEARLTLRASYGRNRRYSSEHPQLVSELSRANGTVASHLGHDGEYRWFTREALRSLIDGTDALDYRHLTARLELADMETRVSGFDQAMVEYDELERDAKRIGRADYVALARLKSAWLSYIKTNSSKRFKEIEALSRSTEPELRGVADGAKVLLAAIMTDRGDKAAADRYLADLTSGAQGDQTLIFVPEWEIVAEAAHRFKDRWIDVAFNVEADGRVTDVEMIRQSGDPRWARNLVASISDRVYTPAQPGSGPNYRVERYTYTAKVGMETGSRAKRAVRGAADWAPGKGTAARVEFLDLTPARAANTGGPSAGQIPGA